MKITIDTHNCSREELAELKEYLENNSWDFKTDEPEKEMSGFRLVDFNEIDIDSGLVILSEKIADEELHEYRIVHRETEIDNLMRWISEGSKSSALMRQDLETLMSWDDEYIFSSISTNSFISSKCSEFDDTCKELIELDESL